MVLVAIIISITIRCLIIVVCVGRVRLLRRCPQGSIWQLILCEVLTHFVQAIDSPEGQLRDLHPSIIHCFGVHDHYDQMETIFFEGCSEARASCWRHSSLHSIEALPEELVGVSPRELTRLVLQVLPRASVVLLDDDLAH